MSLVTLVFSGALAFMGGAFIVIGMGGFLAVASGKATGEARLKLFGHAFTTIQTGALLVIAAVLSA